MFNATNQLNNITNNNLISGSKQWRKPETQLSRSAARELELQQKLKHTTTSLKDKENGNINIEPTKKIASDINLTEAETINKKKEFAKCKFYLDNLESNVQASIERGIKLLGASQEKFFSNKCTHLITTKQIPLQENLLQSSSDTNATKQTNNTRKTDFVPKDTIVENALSWGIVLWSSDVMMKTVDHFMKTSRFQKNKRAQEKRGLGKVLQEEKLFGPSTGANSESQSKRPQFVPFTGHFLSIEDATQVHRPVISRQYTKEVFTKKQSEYPWPHLKPTDGTRSPFGKRSRHTNEEEQVKQPKTPQTATSPVANNINNNIIATPPTTPPVTNNNNNNLDSQHSLRASGFQPSCTNNTPTASTRSNSVSTMPNDSNNNNNNRRLPTGEINRLDKRMVENVTQNEHQKMHKQAIKEKMQRETERARKEKGKRKELRYCENCNCQFEKLDDHLNDPTHQTFIRDQNNFSQLDEILLKTRRTYKSALPDRWKNLIDTNIDAKNVKFQSDGKRPRTASSNSTTDNPNKLTSTLMLNKHTEPPRIAAENTNVVDSNQGWGKYHDVFL